MDQKPQGLSIGGIVFPFSTVIQLIAIAFGIVGAWYTMSLKVESVNSDLRDFLTSEHQHLVDRVNVMQDRQNDNRERARVLESQVQSNLGRIERLESRVFGSDNSDERWNPRGRSSSQERANDQNGKAR